MNKYPTRYHKLLDDILMARHDLHGLAQAHGFSATQLARWIGKPANQKTLAGLCLLADYQTQLLLSRYRSLAATRLIKLAGEEGDGSAETARKACGDLLRLDLKRTEAIANGDGSGVRETDLLQGIDPRRSFYGAARSSEESHLSHSAGQEHDDHQEP